MTKALRERQKIAEEALEAALDSAGWAWSRREKNWAVPANASLPRELHVRLDKDGVRVEAALVEWDAAADEAAEALSRFLRSAQANLRQFRCEINGTTARVVSGVELDRIDDDLPGALKGVAQVVRLLHREAAALLHAEAARAYLAFHDLEKE